VLLDKKMTRLRGLLSHHLSHLIEDGAVYTVPSSSTSTVSDWRWLKNSKLTIQNLLTR
jgi:hypothetical protein